MQHRAEHRSQSLVSSRVGMAEAYRERLGIRMGMQDLDPHLFGTEQQCFGCGPHNSSGMQLRFRRDGDAVVTTFTAKAGWEGAPGIVHGGLQATLADEVGAWTVVTLTGCFGFTSSMQLRYLRPARHGLPIEARGEIISRTESTARVRVTLRQRGAVVLSGTASYVLPTREQAEKFLDSELPEAWSGLTRPDVDNA